MSEENQLLPPLTAASAHGHPQTRHIEDTADFLEFLGLDQTEASSLTWATWTGRTIRTVQPVVVLIAPQKPVDISAPEAAAPRKRKRIAKKRR